MPQTRLRVPWRHQSTASATRLSVSHAPGLPESVRLLSRRGPQCPTAGGVQARLGWKLPDSKACLHPGLGAIAGHPGPHHRTTQWPGAHVSCSLKRDFKLTVSILTPAEVAPGGSKTPNARGLTGKHRTQVRPGTGTSTRSSGNPSVPPP